jgi:hypothetical protein
MLRRGAGDCHSQSRATAAISGTLFGLRACPAEHYGAAASLRNIFRNFMATVDAGKLSVAVVSPRKSQMLPHGV